MTSLWPESFHENTNNAPKAVLEEQAKLLAQMTGGAVYAEVSSLDVIEALTLSLGNDFNFRFDIKGKYLPKYRFNVLMFSHDITLYPVRCLMDEGVASELGVPRSIGGFSYIAPTEQAFFEFLGAVFKTSRVGNVVGSILSITKQSQG